MNEISRTSTKGTIDYSKAKVYMIQNTENDKVYIGSTCWDLSHRFGEHKRACSKARTKGSRLYQEMNDLGFGCFFWDEVEQFPCDNVSQLRAREGYWIRHFKSWMLEHGYNKKMETRTRSEYYKDNRETTLNKAKEYYENNKAKAQTWKNTKADCDCGCAFTLSNKARHLKTAGHISYMNSLAPTPE